MHDRFALTRGDVALQRLNDCADPEGPTSVGTANPMSQFAAANFLAPRSGRSPGRAGGPGQGRVKIL